MKELSTEQITLLFGEKLDSTIFIGENASRILGLSHLLIFDTDNGIINERFMIEGWCYSNSLSYLSKEHGIAIMLWDKKEKHSVWCHISVDYSTTLFRKFELIKK